MFERLDEVNWRQIRDAYGPAVKLPVLLRKLASSHPEEREDALEYLYMGICHQQASVWQATPVVVPFLIEFVGQGTKGQDGVLVLLGHIVRARTPYEAGGEAGTTATPAEQKEWLADSVLEVRKGIRVYIRLLREGTSEVRTAASFVLGNLVAGQKGYPEQQTTDALEAREEVNALTEAIGQERDALVRVSLALALGEVAQIEAGALTPLKTAFAADRDVRVRTACALSLFDTEGEADIQATTTLVDAVSASVKSSILEVNSPWLESNLYTAAFQRVCQLNMVKWPRVEEILLETLRVATSFSADRLVTPILTGLFPIRGEKPSATALTFLQHSALETLLQNEQYWGPISNGEFVLNKFGLPTTRSELKRFLSKRGNLSEP